MEEDYNKPSTSKSSSGLKEGKNIDLLNLPIEMWGQVRRESAPGLTPLNILRKSASIISSIMKSSLANPENRVSKQDLINLYDYINEVTKEENCNLYDDNFDHIKQKILGCKPENISDLLIEEFFKDKWSVRSSDNSSLLTIAIEIVKEKQNEEDEDYDIHVWNVAFLILHMKEELITGLENFVNSKKKTLLHYLAESGEKEFLDSAIKKLRSFDLDIEEEVRRIDEDGKTPLHYAAESGSKECLKLLIENGAHFAETINYKSELHYAAKSGNFELLEYLKEILTKKGIFGEEKGKKDKYGNNVLHYAAQSGSGECVKFLIDNCVQFIKNKYNENPLHKIANARASEDAINYLIENLKSSGRLQSAINRLDVDGNTPLHIAARYGNEELITALVKEFKRLKIDISIKNNKDNTPLQAAIIYGNSGCVKLLIENREVKDEAHKIENWCGKDLVHLAATHGRIDCLKLLLEHPYNINTETDEGNTALHLVISSDTKVQLKEEGLKFLVEKGVDINKSNKEGNTALHLAARFGGIKILVFIIKKMREEGTDSSGEIFCENCSGETVFHMAARAGNKVCLEYLFSLVQGEEIKEILSKENKHKETLLHLAALSGNKECVKYLVEKVKNTNHELCYFLEKKTVQQELLFSAALSGNAECLEFLVKEIMSIKEIMLIKEIVNIKEFFLYMDYRDSYNNTIVHAAALADGKECFQYIFENFVDQERQDLYALVDDNLFFYTLNRHKLMLLHSAAISLNVEVIRCIMDSPCLYYIRRALNAVSGSGRTALHYLIMSCDDFEKSTDEDLGQDEHLKGIVLGKRKQNEHLREKAINAFLYITRENGEKVVNEKINFDIKDNKGKTALDYVLESNNENISKLFLNAFYEIKQNKEKRYNKVKIDYQKRHKYVLRANSIVTPITSIVIMVYILIGMPESGVRMAFIALFVVCCGISFLCAFAIIKFSWDKKLLKDEMKSYTEKIERIKGRIGGLGKSKMGYNVEEYNALMQQVAKNTELTVKAVKNEKKISALEKRISALEAENKNLTDKIARPESRGKNDRKISGVSSKQSSSTKSPLLHSGAKRESVVTTDSTGKHSNSEKKPPMFKRIHDSIKKKFWQLSKKKLLVRQLAFSDEMPACTLGSSTVSVSSGGTPFGSVFSSVSKEDIAKQSSLNDDFRPRVSSDSKVGDNREKIIFSDPKEKLPRVTLTPVRRPRAESDPLCPQRRNSCTGGATKGR